MTLLAPSSLLLQAGDSKEAQRFVLASREWLDLQSRVQSVLALPSDIGEYEERYGDSSSGTPMKECFDAMHKLQQVAARYGSPKQLRTKILNDPNFLANAARPRNDAFSATVWTLERAHRDCAALVSAYQSIPTLARASSALEASAGIKSLFLDRGQIVDNMQHTIDQLDVLIAEFESIEAELDVAQLKMKTYTERSSKTRTELDKEIGGLKETIAKLEKSRSEAYDKWLGLTISACVVPAALGIIGIVLMVLLAVPTGGASFAVGGAITGAAVGASATGLGIAAGIARTAYEDLIAKVDEQNAYLGKRVNYRSDLGALDELMGFSLPASNGVVAQLGQIRSAWAGAIREVGARANELSADTLRHSLWLQEAQMRSSAAGWSTVDQALRAFNVGAFVDADLFDFGSELPQAHPDWQRQFVVKQAA